VNLVGDNGEALVDTVIETYCEVQGGCIVGYSFSPEDEDVADLIDEAIN